MDRQRKHPANKRAALAHFRASNSLKQRRLLCPQPARPTLSFGRPVCVMLGSMAGGRRPFCVLQAAIGFVLQILRVRVCTTPAPFQLHAPRFYCGAGAGGSVGIVVIGWAGC